MRKLLAAMLLFLTAVTVLMPSQARAQACAGPVLNTGPDAYGWYGGTVVAVADGEVVRLCIPAVSPYIDTSLPLWRIAVNIHDESNMACGRIIAAVRELGAPGEIQTNNYVGFPGGPGFNASFDTYSGMIQVTLTGKPFTPTVLTDSLTGAITTTIPCNEFKISWRQIATVDPSIPPYSPPALPPIPLPSIQSLLRPDCNPIVLDAAYARAEALVVRDIAISRQTIRHPDSSVLGSCFSQAAKVVAKRSGDIFSGNFQVEAGDIFGESLTALGMNFVDSILFDIAGYFSSIPLLSGFLGTDFLIGGGPDPVFACDVPDQLWYAATSNGIIRAELRYAPFREILTGAPAGYGPIALENLNEDILMLNAVDPAETALDDLRIGVPSYFGIFTFQGALSATGL